MMQIRRLTDLWGVEGAEPLVSPCRGPAKRGPKGYAGSPALAATDEPVRRRGGRSAEHPDKGSGHGRGELVRSPRMPGTVSPAAKPLAISVHAALQQFGVRVHEPRPLCGG